MPDKEEGGARARLTEAETAARSDPAAVTPLSTFLEACEKRTRLSRLDRLRIVEQALLLLNMNYVHLPLKRAMHAIDPIQRLKLLRFRLLEMKDSKLPSEMQFHQRMIEIFASTRDLHTMYLLPAPKWSAITSRAHSRCRMRMGGCSLVKTSICSSAR